MIRSHPMLLLALLALATCGAEETAPEPTDTVPAAETAPATPTPAAEVPAADGMTTGQLARKLSEALVQALAGVKVTDLTREGGEGEEGEEAQPPTFTISLEVDGYCYEMEVSASGEVMESSYRISPRQLPEDRLPKVVRDAATAAAADLEITEVRRGLEEDGTVVFVVLGTTARGEFELEATEAGLVIHLSHGEADTDGGNREMPDGSGEGDGNGADQF